VATTDTAVAIRPMAPEDVDAADRLMRLAFGTFLGLPDPSRMFGDADMLRSRYATDPGGAFVATLDGEVVGAVYVTRWGSYAFFGPLCVLPELWDRGIGQLLLRPVMELFERWGVRQAGLYTFAQSAKHVGLYQRFGFWPQQLTAVMARPPAASGGHAAYSLVAAGEQAAAEAQCREITDAIFGGLDVGVEIRAVHERGLGDTVLVASGGELVAFAVCHCRAGEATSDSCYVKFGAVRPGADAGERFDELLAACEDLAAERGADVLMAGVNLARHDAYRRMLARGYRTAIQGVVMQRPNEPGFCRPDVHVMDDLR
jgi:predicted N-acetyltransferase YhbS